MNRGKYIKQSIAIFLMVLFLGSICGKDLIACLCACSGETKTHASQHIDEHSICHHGCLSYQVAHCKMHNKDTQNSDIKQAQLSPSVTFIKKESNNCLSLLFTQENNNTYYTTCQSLIADNHLLSCALKSPPAIS